MSKGARRREPTHPNDPQDAARQRSDERAVSPFRSLSTVRPVQSPRHRYVAGHRTARGTQIPSPGWRTLDSVAPSLRVSVSGEFEVSTCHGGRASNVIARFAYGITFRQGWKLGASWDRPARRKPILARLSNATIMHCAPFHRLADRKPVRPIIPPEGRTGSLPRAGLDQHRTPVTGFREDVA